MAEIGALDAVTFRAVVAEDCRGKAPDAVHAALRQPAVLHRWHAALLDISQEIETQMAEREGQYSRAVDVATARAYLAWKGRAARFKLSVDRALREARASAEGREAILLKAVQVIARLDVEHAGQGPVIAAAALERLTRAPEVS